MGGFEALPYQFFRLDFCKAFLRVDVSTLKHYVNMFSKKPKKEVTFAERVVHLVIDCFDFFVQMGNGVTVERWFASHHKI